MMITHLDIDIKNLLLYNDRNKNRTTMHDDIKL